MYKAVANYLCCPNCRRSFTLKVDAEIGDEVLEGALVCENGHTFRITQSVADFNSEEQGFVNQWESMGEEQRFEELDQKMDNDIPDVILERREKVLDTIVGAVSGHKGKIVLDIASGRGLLLTELAAKLEDDVHIISIDLSSFVLKYDYQKLKRIAPNKKISYLACDATNLPLKDCVVDAATTYCGFSNMPGCADAAMQEAHRVLKSGGVLVDSFVIIDRGSKGFELLNQVCSEQNITGAEDVYLHENVVTNHGKRFSAVECNTVFQGIGVENSMDLLPYPGEWYADQVFISKK